jgi:hypothetical protein
MPYGPVATDPSTNCLPQGYTAYVAIMYVLLASLLLVVGVAAVLAALARRDESIEKKWKG